jgi:hypothetical protein
LLILFQCSSCVLTIFGVKISFRENLLRVTVPSITRRTLLLPGNEEIALPAPTPLALPPILPSIVEPPRTPHTPRRHLTVQELLRSPIRRATKKKGKKECTRDDRLKIQSYYEAGLTVKQILEKLPDLTQRQVYYTLKNRITPQRKARG